MKMAVVSGAVMEFGRNRDSGRSQLCAHRARLGLRRVRLSVIGIPHDREPLYADVRRADCSDEACETTTVVWTNAAPGILDLDLERATASRISSSIGNMVGIPHDQRHRILRSENG